MIRLLYQIKNVGRRKETISEEHLKREGEKNC